MPIIPAVCLICGFFISKISRYRNLLFGLVCFVLIMSLWGGFKIGRENSQAGVNLCFAEANKFLADNSIDKNSLVITNQLPIVHYYTQKEVHLYPDPWNLKTFENVLDSDYKNRKIYFFYSNYDMANIKIKKDLNDNFKKVFECSKGWGNSAVYE